MAEQDLAAIGDRSVMAQLMELALNDLPLEFLPQASPDQGGVPDSRPEAAWRRAISSQQAAKLGPTLDGDSDSELETWRIRACDYCLVYREPTTVEHTEAGLHGVILGFVVLRVLEATEMASMGVKLSGPAAAATPTVPRLVRTPAKPDVGSAGQLDP